MELLAPPAVLVPPAVPDEDENALTSLSSPLTLSEAFDGLPLSLLEIGSLFLEWLCSRPKGDQPAFQRARFSVEELLSSSSECIRTATSCLPVPMPSKPLSEMRCVAAKSYYGRPRHDFVCIDGGDERWYGQLERIFHYTDTNISAPAFAVVLLRVYKTIEEKHSFYEVPVIKAESRYQFVSVRAIEHRVLVRPDFRCASHLFVHV